MIFLINPKDKFLKLSGDRAPLGISYLSSYLKDKGHDVKLFDLNHNHIDEYIVRLYSEKPDYVGFSMPTPCVNDVVDIVRLSKGISPDTKFIAGGNHPTNCPQDDVYNEFDFVVRGEGEKTLELILNNKTTEHIIIGEPIKDLDSLPFPDYEGIKLERYGMKLNGKKGSLMVTSRGCVYNCIYCPSSRIKNVRVRSPGNIIDEMMMLYYNHKVRGFYFGDDVFTLNKNRVYEFCKQLKDVREEHGIHNITWRCTTRSNLVDKDLLGEMKESGCDIISIGIESHNNYFLNIIKKGITKEENEQTIRDAKEVGMKVKGFFILGLPTQTYQDCLDTIKYARCLNLDYVDFYPLCPYPGTELWDNPDKFGLKYEKPNGNWKEYYQVGKEQHDWKLIHPNITQQQMNRLLTKAKNIQKGDTYQ